MKIFLFQGDSITDANRDDENQDKFDELSSDGDTRYWSVDGIHPTSAGHQVIKEELQKVVANYIF